MTEDRPLLVFFSSVQSGPSRRMDSLLAHIAHKERHRVRFARVDVDQSPALTLKFHIQHVPTLILVEGNRIVERIEGRATAPTIELTLARHLPAAVPAAA